MIMSNTIKLTALLSCLVILCGCFVSCVIPGGGEGGGNNNTGGLPSDKYVATIKVSYATEDEKLASAVSAMNNVVTTVTANGDDLKVSAVASLGGVTVNNEYVYIEDMLYYSITLGLADKSATDYKKSAMTDTDRDALLSKVGPGASIGVKDFLKFDKVKEDNLTTYTCSNMTGESKDSLAKVFASKLSAIGATAIVNSASYTLKLVDDRNSASTLSCDLTVTMDGAEYQLTVNIECEYDYDADTSVSAPQNADKYTEVTLSEIIG